MVVIDCKVAHFRVCEQYGTFGFAFVVPSLRSSLDRVDLLFIRPFGLTFLWFASALPSSYIATLQFVRQGSSAIKREIFS